MVIDARLVSVNVQVTLPPFGTEKLCGVPEVHVADVRSQPSGTVSATEYAPALTEIAPVVPVVFAVTILGDDAVGPVTVKLKVSSPPTVFLTIVICPAWSSLVMVQALTSPAASVIAPLEAQSPPHDPAVYPI